MERKSICFRFDVDTHKCAKVGMRNLIELAQRKGVLFTFFLNCGVSISRYHSAKAIFSKKHDVVSYPQLSARRKFGDYEYIRCAIVNPQIGVYAKEVILRAFQEGHEIGLHGGRNHELWGRFVNKWSDEKIRNEILWGLDQLKGFGIIPQGFASPCANGGDRVRRIISEFENFRYVSDALNPNSTYPKKISSGVVDIPTALCGEGGVAYIEQHVALGKSKAEILEDFKSKLNLSKTVVFYDHPYFAGDEALDIMDGLVDAAKDLGFEVTTMKKICEIYENSIYRP